MNKTKIDFFLKIFTVMVALFLYLPILIVTLYSFSSAEAGIQFKGFTLKWYKALFQDQMIMSAMKNTFTIGIISSLTSTFLGVLGTYTIYKTKKKFKNPLLFLNNIPIINPDLVTGVSLFILFIFIHLSLGFTTLLMAHIAFSVPYTILILYPKMNSISPYCIEAAYDLGATETQTFFKIILPQIKPALITAILICFTLSIDDFIVSFFTTGNNVQNLSIVVYSIAKRGIRPSINALCALIFLLIFALLFLINKKLSLTELEGLDNAEK